MRFKAAILTASLAIFALAGLPARALANAGHGGTVSADNAWKMLREGNERFARGLQVHPHTSKERREELRKGQEPFATVLSCSDSRLPSERLLDQGFGDIFTVRVAGNYAATEMVIGTVEYGVLHLGTNLVLVLGHESCGAVKAAVGHVKDPGTSVEALVAHLQHAADEAADNVGKLTRKEDILNEAIERNVLHSMRALMKASPKIRAEMRDGKVKVVGGIYSLATNRISWLGEHPDQDEILSTPEEKAASKK